MTRTVAIIQARTGSSRFPGKVLADLGGKPVLQWVVEAADATPGIDEVWVATSKLGKDGAIVDWCDKNDVWCFVGSETDVLSRYAGAAAASKADIIVRLTGDCPMLVPDVIAQVIALRAAKAADYASNVDPPTWPDGLDCEVFMRHPLEIAAATATSPYEREHVGPAIRRAWRSVNLVNPEGDFSHQKWSIDTPEDLERVRAMVTADA